MVKSSNAILLHFLRVQHFKLRPSRRVETRVTMDDVQSDSNMYHDSVTYVTKYVTDVTKV